MRLVRKNVFTPRQAGSQFLVSFANRGLTSFRPFCVLDLHHAEMKMIFTFSSDSEFKSDVCQDVPFAALCFLK